MGKHTIMPLFPFAPSLWLILMMLLSPAPSHADLNGSDLATRVYNRPDGNDAVSIAEMILTEKGHTSRFRKLYSYRLDKPDGQTWVLLRFSAPADIKNTGLLTYSSPAESNTQWIYLPALDRARRIASSRKGGRFVGSDIYYEDLQKREVEDDHHRILGKRKLGKIPTILLESIPVDPGNSSYSKRLSWIHIKTLLPLRVDYFKNNSDQPVKRLKASKIKKIQGFWTVVDSTVTDLESGHQTRMRTSTIKYDQALPDRLFSRQSLADSNLEKHYRP